VSEPIIETNINGNYVSSSESAFIFIVVLFFTTVLKIKPPGWVVRRQIVGILIAFEHSPMSLLLSGSLLALSIPSISVQSYDG